MEDYFDIDDIIAEYGSEVRDTSSKREIFGQLFQSSETIEIALESRFTSKTVLDFDYFVGTSVMQAFQDEFVAKGGVKITPNKFELEHVMIDVAMNPNKLYDSWYHTEFTDIEEKDRSVWGVVQYWVRNHILKQRDHDIEVDIIWKGNRVDADETAVPRVAGTAQGSFTGLEQRLADAILSTTDNVCTPVTLGALPPNTVAGNELLVQYVEDLCDQSDELLINKIKTLYMSKKLAKRYRKGVKSGYNGNYFQNEETEVDGYDIKIVGLASMTGSNRIWGTIEGNAKHRINKGNAKDIFKAVPHKKKQVAVMGDWYEGCGFAINNWIVCNDQA